ncbi:hypothetical protein BKA63DRAFT_557838 [Paraphoma chrysanthemicola]|nr:hypothetical protein BKA63DRAFT_557838 [Paraphoma chrysanthemicola]
MTEIYREYMFTSNVTDFVCPLWVGPPRYICFAPSVCATALSTPKQYCCNPGDLSGSVNVCWSSAKNPIQNTSATALNKTFSSLSSAQPSASYYVFDPAVVIAQAVPTSTQPTSATSSSALSSEQPSTNQISGGAVAGIVIGVVAIIAIACLAAVLFLRSRKRNQSVSNESTRSRKDRRPVEEVQIHLDNTPQEMQANSIKPAELPNHRM